MVDRVEVTGWVQRVMGLRLVWAWGGKWIGLMFVYFGLLVKLICIFSISVNLGFVV